MDIIRDAQLKGKGKILEIERGSTRSHSVQNSLWKRLMDLS
jgi:hypothetical protein